MAANHHDCNTIFYKRACDLFGDMRQQRVADMTGLAQGKISDILTYRAFPERYQNKKPSAEMVYKIAKAFNVSTDYLLGLTDYKTNNKEEEKIEDEQMKITLTTDRGTWIVTAGRMTYLFTNSDQALRFVEVCHKGVR